MFEKSIAKKFEREKLQFANQNRHTENCKSNDKMYIKPAIFLCLLVMVAFGISHAREEILLCNIEKRKRGQKPARLSKRLYQIVC
jgi:hypothetical protein